MVGAVAAALVFLIVLSLFELEVTDKPGVAISRPVVTGSVNVISNPSAEGGTFGWGSISSDLNSVESDEAGVTGDNVFRLAPKYRGTEIVTAFSPEITLATGDTMTASATLISISGGQGVNMGIDWKTRGGDFVGSPPDGRAQTEPGARISISAVAPPHARIGVLRINFLDAGKGDSLEFDAVRAKVGR